MSGFLTDYGGGGQIDLDLLFATGDTGLNTGFVATDGRDLGRRFAEIDRGSALGYVTGFTALDGRDLNSWFAKGGTVVADWPVGGGFMLFQNGSERFVTDTTTALVGRMSWQINANGTDSASSNLIADRFNACPGVASGNAGLWQDFGGFSRNAFHRLPASAVLRFEYGTAAIGAPVVYTTGCTLGSHISGWVAVISGPTAQCSNVSPYVDDSMNVNGFVPPGGTYFGSLAASLQVNSSQNWFLRVTGAFACNLANGSFNEHRIYVTRIS